jgi:quercetin dioxygenase-like cupin family protein
VEFGRVDDTKGDPPAEVAEHFQGRARLQRLPAAFPDEMDIFAVHFEPGGRTKPHVHPDGQLLVIAAGKGIIGSRDGRRVVEAGDVVAVMPDEWHWHGATPSTPMTHITIQMPGPDSIDWNVDEGDWASGYED